MKAWLIAKRARRKAITGFMVVLYLEWMVTKLDKSDCVRDAAPKEGDRLTGFVIYKRTKSTTDDDASRRNAKREKVIVCCVSDKDNR